MTDANFDNPALHRERREKQERGYIWLGGLCPNENVAGLAERFFSIEEEALSAGLLWEKESYVVSVRDMGVTKEGARFFLVGEHSCGLRPDFYVKPGMIRNLLSFLDDAPEAIEVRVALKIKEEKHRKEVEERIVEAEEKKEYKLEDEYEAEPENKNLSIEYIKESLPDNHYNPKKETDCVDEKKGSDHSPSVVAIFSGFASLVVLAFLKVLIEDRHGQGSADHFFDPILIFIIAGVPTFIALRYIFKEGVASAGYRSKNLIISAFVFLIVIWILSLLGGGSSDCFYRVGCI
tara:strand:- start:190 stop:1065 length:876 start_codon:yes stop_codon:yes gene_type:complete